MARNKSDYISHLCNFVFATEGEDGQGGAVLVDLDEANREWIPRSTLSWKCDREVQRLIDAGDRNVADFNLEVVDWKAKQLGLG